MSSAGHRTGLRAAWALAASLGAMAAVGVALPALAQDDSSGRSPPGATQTAMPTALEPAVPAATPMTDLLTRMDALETQVARLTAQNEEMANKQRQLEAKLAPALVPAQPDAPPPAAPTAMHATAPIEAKSATASNLAAMTGKDHVPGPARPSAQRLAAVKAVIKPDTGDAGLDEYSYGFRLYSAKFYPEAAQQLKLYIDKYPKDAHVSHARNLLGRAYLDDGKPREAAPWFLMNYKSDPQGPRAADSLLNLAEAMRQLGDNDRACVALNEFASTYATDAQGRLRQDYTRTRGGLTCN